MITRFGAPRRLLTSRQGRTGGGAGSTLDERITHLLKEQRPVNFKTVAETAGISTAWLYGNEALKQRIMHLRVQQVPAVQVKSPPREQASNASKDAMIAALRQRIKKLEEEKRTLTQQVEVANGLLYQREGKPGRWATTK